MFDVITIGGSYAGISAALQIARGRRSVLVIDAGQRRNRFAPAAHGLLGHDGEDPTAIWARGRAQLLAYPTVQWREARVDHAVATADGFEVVVGTDTLVAKRLVLATGVVDELPAIAGLADRWGTSAFHCPYCHGYELDGGPVGVIATSPSSVHHARLLPEWGPTTYFTRGLFEPSDDELAALARRNVAIERAPIEAIEGRARVVLANGATHELAGLFVAPTLRLSPLAAELGCELETNQMGTFIKTDMIKETTVRNVFAAGDVTTGANLAMAIGDGARAGASAHMSLAMR